MMKVLILFFCAIFCLGAEGTELSNRLEKMSLQNQNSGGTNSWRIEKGQSLNQVLYLWTKKSGWNLVWEASNDYSIASSATIEGDFNAAIQQLFSYTGQLTPPIYISLYGKNKVLRVSSTN